MERSIKKVKDIKVLKQQYFNLPRQEKKIIGAAMVKVNLGVGLPADLKVIAGFLKGSHLIAKAGKLHELIHELNQDNEAKEPSIKQTPSKKIKVESHPMSKTLIRNVSTFEEDAEVTAKEEMTVDPQKKDIVWND